MRKFLLFFGLCLTLAGLVLFAGCGGGSGGGDGATGTLRVELTDNATDDYDAVYVTVDLVQVHFEGDDEDEWIDVMEPGTTYNLLELMNGVTTELGLGDLEEGHYTQLRLILGDTPDGELNILDEAHPFANYVIHKGTNAYEELTIPSGFESGIKITHGFDIVEGDTTELILDFDADQSIHLTGSNTLIMRPTIGVVQ